MRRPPGARTPNNVSGNFSFFLLLFLIPLFKTPEGVVIGIQNFAGLLTPKNIRIPIKKNIGGPPYPPHYAIFECTKGGNFKSCPWHEALSNKNMRIPHPKNSGTYPPPARTMLYLDRNIAWALPIKKQIRDPPIPHTLAFFGGKGGDFQKLSYGSKTSDRLQRG